MSKHISLSYNDETDLVGVIYDYLENRADVELDNDDYDKIEESVTTLLEYLNEE